MQGESAAGRGVSRRQLRAWRGKAAHAAAADSSGRWAPCWAGHAGTAAGAPVAQPVQHPQSTRGRALTSKIWKAKSKHCTMFGCIRFLLQVGGGVARGAGVGFEAGEGGHGQCCCLTLPPTRTGPPSWPGWGGLKTLEKKADNSRKLYHFLLAPPEQGLQHGLAGLRRVGIHPGVNDLHGHGSRLPLPAVHLAVAAPATV